MKLCSFSPKFKDSLVFILNDNEKKFFEKLPDNFSGKIDNKLFFNFCIESNSIKIIKKILKNQQLTNSIETNLETWTLLIKNKALSTKEKTYIYTKLNKNKTKISEKRLFKVICQYDKNLLFWLNKSKSLNNQNYKNLFFSEIKESEIEFCRRKKLNIVNLLLKAHKRQIICFENYLDLFSENELIELINESLKKLLKEEDINLLDSLIKILINNPKLIDKTEIKLLEKIKVTSFEMFNFLNVDIEKILLYKKFSLSKHKEKIKKI